jgi:hypothetical protein
MLTKSVHAVLQCLIVSVIKSTSAQYERMCTYFDNEFCKSPSDVLPCPGCLIVIILLNSSFINFVIICKTNTPVLLFRISRGQCIHPRAYNYLSLSKR